MTLKLMRSLVLCCLCLISASIVCSAQKQGNIWLLGDRCLLDFNTYPPTPSGGYATTNGQVMQSKASICDTGGRLLFFTDAVAIFNSRGFHMMNGGGINGHLSSQQSSIIIPLPGSDSLYYVFTSDASENYATWISPVPVPAGYNYSIVDMSHLKR